MFRRMTTSSDAMKKKSDDPSPAGDADEKNPDEYTLPGVLHFIEHKMRSFEEDRNQWKLEEAELKTHVAVLKGQIKANGFMTVNLMRRIAMLEFCLKQERKESALLKKKIGDPNLDIELEEPDEEIEDHGRMTMFSDDFHKLRDAHHMAVESIKNEVEEIEQSINGSLYRPKSRFSVTKTPDFALLEYELKQREDEGKPAEGSSSCDDILDDSFEFLERERGEKKSLQQRMVEYRELREKAMSKKKSREALDDEEYSAKPTERFNPGESSAKPIERFNPDASIIEDYLSAIQEVTEKNDQPLLVWNAKKSLRSHLDCVRSVVFHPLDPVLFTASEDGTIKQWFVGGHQTENIVPVCTLRGHSGAVISLAMDVEGQVLCSGGADGYICYWSPPVFAEFKDIRYGSHCKDPYEKFSNRQMITGRVLAHNDIVWSLAMVGDRVISASADGLVKIWCSSEGAVEILPPRDSGNPVAIEVLQDVEGQAVVAYQNSCVVVISYLTAEILRKFDFGRDTGCTVTAIVSHPSLNITCVACTDHKIRFFQNDSGALTSSLTAHTDAVSCLAMDTDGHVLLSGCHDGTIRIWDFERRICLQEIKAHRTKGDQGVLSLAFHNNFQMLGCGGADHLAKILLP